MSHIPAKLYKTPRILHTQLVKLYFLEVLHVQQTRSGRRRPQTWRESGRNVRLSDLRCDSRPCFPEKKVSAYSLHPGKKHNIVWKVSRYSPPLLDGWMHLTDLYKYIKIKEKKLRNCRFQVSSSGIAGQSGRELRVISGYFN